MIFCDKFAYNPTIKTLDIADENAQPASFGKMQTAFLQVEEQDEDREGEVVKKLLKNLKWVCGKNNTRNVFKHLKPGGSFYMLDFSEFNMDEIPALHRYIFKTVECKYAFDYK